MFRIFASVSGRRPLALRALPERRRHLLAHFTLIDRGDLTKFWGMSQCPISWFSLAAIHRGDWEGPEPPLVQGQRLPLPEPSSLLDARQTGSAISLEATTGKSAHITYGCTAHHRWRNVLRTRRGKEDIDSANPHADGSRGRPTP